MLDSFAERLLTYRLSAAYDCWGHRRAIRHGSRNGIWFLDPRGLDDPQATAADAPTYNREQKLAELAVSGRFTPTELATLHALVVEHLTIDDIARRDGCSRQAVVARLTGNSRGQGGILRKARSLLRPQPLSE